jgi:hypothetical protein
MLSGRADRSMAARPGGCDDEAITSDLGANLSLSGARAQLQTAVQQLGASYQATYAKIGCS